MSMQGVVTYVKHPQSAELLREVLHLGRGQGEDEVRQAVVFFRAFEVGRSECNEILGRS